MRRKGIPMEGCLNIYLVTNKVDELKKITIDFNDSSHNKSQLQIADTFQWDAVCGHAINVLRFYILVNQ